MLAKLIPIGNSKGMRLPKRMIIKYNFDTGMIIEEHEDGILIKPKGGASKLSWEETYKSMASDSEDWSDMDCVNGDGLD